MGSEGPEPSSFFQLLTPEKLTQLQITPARYDLDLGFILKIELRFKRDKSLLSQWRSSRSTKLRKAVRRSSFSRMPTLDNLANRRKFHRLIPGRLPAWVTPA